MPEFRPDELSQWVSGLWKNGMPDDPVTGVSNDTRTIQPGNLYVAIRGENFDGHDFVRQAFEKGAGGALVSERFEWSENPVLHVPDTIGGLQEMARGYRKKWFGTIVGITGSVGKTTVKEMCADVLSMRGEAHRTVGNYNNHIGLPLSMMNMPYATPHGVFEIGMNHPGEIAPLAGLLQPNIGIITDIGNAHREHFQSMEEIALEKARLAEQVPESGMVILDRDSEWFSLIRDHTCAGVITVSMESDADYVGHATAPSVLSVESRTSNLKPHTFSLPLPGEHMMKNALRAIALGLELEMEPTVIAEGLNNFKLPAMRWEESDVLGIKFINDAYNANPLSMHANLRTFAALPGSGKKWAVVGGMRELGDTSEAEHAGLGRFIDELGLDGVVAVGELGKNIICRGTDRFFHVPNAEKAAQILKDHLHPGDRVLLKASRGERLEQALKHFKEI
jgi:UDP-N-acetylmuramoyl-tripeptide--D-alanyl-D-alanine ligase